MLFFNIQVELLEFLRELHYLMEIFVNVQQVEAWIGHEFKEGQETIITALPMYHIFALTANCVVFFRYGAKNILITNPRDMKGFARFKKESVYFYHRGEYAFQWITKSRSFPCLDFSKLKMALGGGMAVQDVVAAEWEKVTGSPF